MSNHTRVKLDKLQYEIHYSSKLRSMHCLAYLLFMLHNEETTLLQQEVHLERNTQRVLCSAVSNDGISGVS